MYRLKSTGNTFVEVFDTKNITEFKLNCVFVKYKFLFKIWDIWEHFCNRLKEKHLAKEKLCWEKKLWTNFPIVAFYLFKSKIKLQCCLWKCTPTMIKIIIAFKKNHRFPTSHHEHSINDSHSHAWDSWCCAEKILFIFACSCGERKQRKFSLIFHAMNDRIFHWVQLFSISWIQIVDSKEDC